MTEKTVCPHCLADVLVGAGVAAAPAMSEREEMRDQLERLIGCGWFGSPDALVDAILAIVGPAASAWMPIETAPKHRFILVYCPEDDSTWLAKWQGGEWYGSDCEHGILRTGYSFGDPNVVTGWAVTQWSPVSRPEGK